MGQNLMTVVWRLYGQMLALSFMVPKLGEVLLLEWAEWNELIDPHRRGFLKR